MDDLHFLRPLWLLAAPIGLALVWLAWRRARSGEAWSDVCDPRLLPHLLVDGGHGGPRVRFALIAIGAIVASIALAGPAWERLERPVYRSQAARVVALDLSRSMGSTDLAPSRLVQARFKAADILRRSRDGRTGLVVFAGDAYTVAPLTEDHRTLLNLLPSAATDIVPVQGSRPDRGLAQARTLLEQAGARTGEVILVTDGTSGDSAEHAAERLRADGFRVSVLAVGTANGAPVPLPDGGFLKDLSGDIVLPRVDHASLRAIARAGGGRFAAISSGDDDLDHLLGARVDDPWRLALERVERTTDEWRDAGPWVALALLPLGALAFRRGWLLAAPLAIGLGTAPPPAAALDWADLWSRPDQRTAHELADGDPERAAAIAPDHRWRGSALYRAGRFDDAAEAFADGTAADDHYNRGNALARAGALEAAIAAYDAALDAESGHADAKHNRAIVEAMLRQQTQRSGEGGDGAGRPEPGRDEARARDQGPAADVLPGEGRDGESQADSGGEQRDAESAGDAAANARGDERRGDAGEQRAARADGTGEGGADAGARATRPIPRRALSDDERLALEQWLRRIPDDPGGLLRRKFEREHQLRRRRAPDHSDAW